MLHLGIRWLVLLLLAAVLQQPVPTHGQQQGVTVAGADVQYSALLQYHHSLPAVQLRKGLVYQGSNFRLRRVMHGLMQRKQPIKVGIIGRCAEAA